MPQIASHEAKQIFVGADGLVHFQDDLPRPASSA
jgi:hypothetical protein